MNKLYQYIKSKVKNVNYNGRLLNSHKFINIFVKRHLYFVKRITISYSIMSCIFLKTILPLQLCYIFLF